MATYTGLARPLLTINYHFEELVWLRVGIEVQVAGVEPEVDAMNGGYR